MPDKQTVRFGLLGAGLIAPFHARAIQAAEGCELVGLTDLDQRRAAELAGQFGCKVFADYDDMLADGTIDVINVLLPNHLHAVPTLAAAAAGKHALVEKPPAMSLAETDEMIAAFDAAGRKLGVVLNCRTRPAIRAIRRAVDQGRFGRLLCGDAYMKWYRPAEYYRQGDWHAEQKSGGGVTVMQAFHYTDLLQYLLGPPAAVEARMTNLVHPNASLDDTLRAFIEFANGAVGTVVASTAMWPGTDIRIEINGENGTAIMAGERLETWRFRDERPEDESVRTIGRGKARTGAAGAADLDFVEHQNVVEGIARAVREDAEPLMTFPSARVTLEMTLALYKSANTGQRVTLSLTDENVWA